MRTDQFSDMGIRRWRVLVALISLAFAVPLQASFHLMQIEQVIGGINGDPTAQAVQLRMRSNGENFVTNAKLIAYDAAGNNPITLITFPSGVTNGAVGTRILISTASFQTHTSIPSDFTMEAIPPSYLAAGRLAYLKPTYQMGNVLWSVSWGGVNYTGPNTGTMDNDADGNFAPPFGNVLPSTSTVALQFTGAATAMSTNNAADYALTPGAATFTNNAGDSTSLAPSTLGNISTRLRVETDDNVLIGGFIITGTQPKKVIVRAIGPSLSSFLSDALADPTLELHDSSGGLIASNDNWRIGGQEAEIIATGIPPSSDLESAIVATLPANSSAYTAIVRGVNNTTGIGVVEAYDLDRTVDSKLANISTRGFVQTGDNVLIGGIIVLGQSQLRVIVRAIGPSLPVPGALADPTLELHDGSGALIASNDNWRSDQEAEIMATTIPPTNDMESAIVRNLTPGNYTAIVRGVSNSTGIALVEAFQLGAASTPTPSPSPTPSATSTPSATPTSTAGPSATPTPTPSGTPSPTPTPVVTPAAKFANLSTRDTVETGDAVTVDAFVITGPVPKRVIVRGIGPSLAQVGVPNPLPDPVMELHGSGGFSTVTNNNWRDTQETEIIATGLAPTNDLESAIVATLAPGEYTVVLRGNNGVTGTGLDEVYDLDSASSRLTAVGTRGRVLAGSDVMVSGVIMTEGGSVLLRVLGPSLSGTVAGALADPTLQLRDGNGALIASNDNWRTDQQAEIIATGIPPTNDLESATVQTLTPGSYTAVGSGFNNTTGIGYVQFYGLPHSGPVLPVTP